MVPIPISLVNICRFTTTENAALLSSQAHRVACGADTLTEDLARLSAVVKYINKSSEQPEKQTSYLVDIIACRAWKIPFLTEPMPFDLHFKSALNHRVASELSQRTLRKLVDLSFGGVSD